MRVPVIRIPSERQTGWWRRLVQEFFWVVLGQLVGAAGGVFGVRVLTSALEPARYGELALGVTLVMLVQQSAMGPIAQASLRYFGPALESGRFGAYLRGLEIRTLQSSLGVIAVAAATTIALMQLGHKSWVGLTVAAFAYSMVAGIGAVLEALQIAGRQRLAVAWYQGFGQWLRPVLAAVLVGLVGATSTAAMIGYVAATLVMLLFQSGFLYRHFRHQGMSRDGVRASDVKDYAGLIFAYAWPFSAWGVLTWLQTASDRWALQVLQGVQNVGVYAAAVQLGYFPLVILSNAMIQLASPVIFASAGDGRDPARLKNAMSLGELVIACLLTLTAVAVVFTAIFQGPLVAYFVAPAYRGSASFLPWLALAAGLFGAGQAASVLLLTGVNSRALVAPKAVTAVLGVGLNVIGAYWGGIAGVVFANVAFAGAYFVWMFALARGFQRRLDLGLLTHARN